MLSKHLYHENEYLIYIKIFILISFILIEKIKQNNMHIKTYHITKVRRISLNIVRIRMLRARYTEFTVRLFSANFKLGMHLHRKKFIASLNDCELKRRETFCRTRNLRHNLRAFLFNTSRVFKMIRLNML